MFSLRMLIIKLKTDYYKGKEFIIETRNNSPEIIYSISEIENGKPFEKFTLSHFDITRGGEMAIELSKKKNQ